MVQAEAVQALRWLAIPAVNKVSLAAAGAVPALVQTLKAESSAMQETAATALACMALGKDNGVSKATRGAIPCLVQLLASAAPRVQEAAAGALQNIASHQTVMHIWRRQ
jgi:hypothetical protein